MNGRNQNRKEAGTWQPDRGGAKEPADFLAKQGIAQLPLYNDATGEATIQLMASGLPLTVVVNNEGKEIAWLIGPADWDSPGMVAQIEALMASNVSGRADGPAIALEGNVTRP